MFISKVPKRQPLAYHKVGFKDSELAMVHPPNGSLNKPATRPPGISSRIPKLYDPSRYHDPNRRYGNPSTSIPDKNILEDKCYGLRRIPTPIPKSLPSVRNPLGMSRQNRGGPPPTSSTASSSGATGGGGSTGVPLPVVQQPQQYLDENVKTWTLPTSQASDRDEIQPLPLGATSSGEPHGTYHHHHTRVPSGSSTSSGAGASRHHNASSPRVPPLTSPSSGYSEHSDPYLSLGSSGSEVGAKHFPHSLSFGGCSQHSMPQGTSYSTPCGNPTFAITQPSAAASFFARAAQRLNLSTKKKRRTQDSERSTFHTNFREIIKTHPPPVPPGLLRITGRKEVAGVGKVKVMLRMCPSNEASSADASYITVDSRKKQVTLYDPTVCGQDVSGERHTGIAAPKMFAFDAVFAPDDNQAEVCSSSLCDVISSVVGGSDGCLFVYGHSKLGKTGTMVGNSNSVQELGVIPCAIWWLFRAINEQKHRTGARFSVRVSAVEVSGKVEELRDLLAEYAAGTEGSTTAPGVYLRDDPVFGSQLMNQSELRAPTAERAAFLLDAALAARTPEHEDDARNAHFLFTLHVYQYRVEKGGRGGVAGGRSRLHLFDLGSCEKTSKSRDGSSGGCLSLSALGNVILTLFNGQKHVPYKESKLTQLLREAVGSVMCRAVMIAHVSTSPSRYPETLATLQLASRIHRLRRKKLKFSTATDTGPIGDDKGVCRPFVRIHAVGEDGGVKSGSSDQDYTSSSEQSCDTVIFVGSGRGTPIPGGICDKHPGQLISPLAKESQSTQSPATPTKKQVIKSHSSSHHAEKSASVGTATVSTVPVKEQKSSEHASKSALSSTDQARIASAGGTIASPKKKAVCSPAHSSPKHQKVVETDSPKMSPKMSKYVMMEYAGDSKKAKGSSDSPGKSSPFKSSKINASGAHPKTMATSSSNISGSPQSQRKSKRSHKPEIAQQHLLFQQQQQTEGSSKLLMKEQKPSSDETWIDGPRFTKPKFDSRTLHQLQKEKWVDGPGMYGYMDVQKETMIRKWVEDHSRMLPDHKGSRKEVWIDFPPNADGKGVLHMGDKHAPSQADAAVADKRGATEKMKKDSKPKFPDQSSSHPLDTHHYAKPTSRQMQRHPAEENVYSNVNRHKEDKSSDIAKPAVDEPHTADLENSLNGNLSEILSQADQDSIKSSNSSVDFNDNNSEDLSHGHSTSSDNEKCPSGAKVCSEDRDGCFLLTDNNAQGEFVMMVDTSIQVTEEDIFSCCGWPQEFFMDNHHFSDTDSYEGTEHPLHVLSAEDLNLASSFTDSRANSVDFETLSVPEGWTADCQDMDPDLTWRLLRGGSLPHHGTRVSHSKNINSNDAFKSKNNILASKLERLANLRHMIEQSNGESKWKSTLMPELNNLCSSENRFPFVSKLHHSADSSLEELRDYEVNSIHSEPAELDIENFDFQFNIKPMNGLRLEAFYNKIHKVPLFPDCFSQSGKPTQVVPPIMKHQTKYIKLPMEDLDAFKSSYETQLKENEPADGSPGKSKRRWNESSGKYGTISNETSKQHSVEESKICKAGENAGPEKSAPISVPEQRSTAECVSTEKIHQSLTEIIQEQRCRVYSEGPSSSSPVPVHTTKCFSQRTKSKIVSECTVRAGKSMDSTELRHEYIVVKQHQRKKGSPKLPPRGILNSYRGNQGKQTKQGSALCSHPSASSSNHLEASPGQCSSQAGVSASTSWTPAQPGGAAAAAAYGASIQLDPSGTGQKGHILCRSTSTPTSPFTSNPPSNVDSTQHAESYSFIPNVVPSVTTVQPPSKKESVWVVRQSSSGHGSDSSVISTEIKETKDLLGKMAKTQQFSGTSSGYESMPRDSEGTPLSSSSQESSSEVGAKKDSRGRKGTRKKSQGSNKRSRSVPARPLVTNSPTWQQQQQPLSNAVARQQIRNRLVRDLHDPTLWKSEEDVCCTSLLCCRLLDFY